ncbi:MAG: hypothetical protein EBQ96_05740 [Proteobacteria bacterium]|nr:hypothetical protein [Pseudomonadota bacterium]
MMDRHKFLHLAALLLPVLFLAGWSGALSWRYYNSPTYDVVMAGYDPRDIVYGKYIMFRYDWDHPESQKPEGIKNLPVSGRFYVPEHAAYDLQEMMRNSSGHIFKATITLSGRDSHIKKVTIDTRPWQEALAAWRETQHNQAQ